MPDEESLTNLDPLGNAVSRLFGLSYLFPYQRLVISNILEAAQAAGIPLHWPDAADKSESIDNDKSFDNTETAGDYSSLGKQIVILPSGAGKSLCFQLPAMLMKGPTLVIYPILSLMADQERRLHERGFSPVILRGAQSAEERAVIWEKLRSGQSKFIIANPEVLLTPQVMKQFETIQVIHIVIDEAHCVSEWGESFRPGYLEINSIIKAVKAPLVTAFTATASAPVLEKIQQYIFGNDEAHRIIGNPDRSNIMYTAKGCIVRNLAVRDLLIASEKPAIVFCSSRKGTEKLAAYLRSELREMKQPRHNEIRFYHAGLSRDEKSAVEKWFMGNPHAVLCATCAYGMGVDKADVRTVIHRDCAPSVEAYLQESGRAGRDGSQSKAILLFGPDDETALRRAKDEASCFRLRQLLHYAKDTAHCRRHALLEMLDYEGGGESPETHCCDVCENQASAALREESSLVNFFRRNKNCYTISEGSAALSCAGNIRLSETEAREAVSFLVKTGKLAVSHSIFGKGKLWKH